MGVVEMVIPTDKIFYLCKLKESDRERVGVRTNTSAGRKGVGFVCKLKALLVG